MSDDHVLQRMSNGIAELGYETGKVTPITVKHSKRTPKVTIDLYLSAIFVKDSPYSGGYRIIMCFMDPTKDGESSFMSTVDFQMRYIDEALKLIKTLERKLTPSVLKVV